MVLLVACRLLLQKHDGWPTRYSELQVALIKNDKAFMHFVEQIDVFDDQVAHFSTNSNNISHQKTESCQKDKAASDNDHSLNNATHRPISSLDIVIQRDRYKLGDCKAHSRSNHAVTWLLISHNVALKIGLKDDEQLEFAVVEWYERLQHRACHFIVYHAVRKPAPLPNQDVEYKSNGYHSNDQCLNNRHGLFDKLLIQICILSSIFKRLLPVRPSQKDV